MRVEAIIERFGAMSALVAGDICLDRWCTYDPAAAEPSRETGIPRTAVVATLTTPGAGGTVANNLAALGVGRVAVLGAIGDDGFGFELGGALERRRIEPDLLVRSPRLSTFTYTKLLNARTGEEDRPRVDFINVRPLDAEVERQVLDALRDAVGAFDVILISDQAETDHGGVVTAAMRSLVAELAARHPEKVFWVDSRLRIDLFRGVVVKPNQQEADEACRRQFGRVDYQALRRLIGPRPLVVTHGGEGARVYDESGCTVVPTRNVGKPVDICGAGDSFSAGAAMALAAGGSIVEAARFGSLVASITIMQKGTGSASPAQVLAAAREWPG